MSRSRKPPPDFFSQSTLEIARALIGMQLVHEHGAVQRRGRIVETEAYLGPRDRAAHSSRGRTPRTEVMFGPPGYAYVYLIYGMWNCLNVVTAEPGVPHAVLLRALEPVANLKDGECTWGPGLLCRALKITRAQNGLDLRGNVLWLERAPARVPAPRIARSTRIGVASAGIWAQRRWRFFDSRSAYVSTASARARREARGFAGPG